MTKTSSFLLVKINKDSSEVLSKIKHLASWAMPVYGPWQVVAYVEANEEVGMVKVIEAMRGLEGVAEVDARRVKVIPRDDELAEWEITKAISAVLLINVNYKEEKERVVTWNLREVDGVAYARAMWGPTDIVAVVEADDHEAMRNLICDHIKTLKGVKENCTLYCYPKS